MYRYVHLIVGYALKDCFLFVSLLLFFIEVELIYNVVPVSAVQESDSVVHTHIYIYLHSFPLWFITGY